MKKKFFRALIWLVIKLNVYKLWSRFHQALFQRNRVEIPHYKHVNQIMTVVRQSKWRADTWWILGDVISHPEWAYQDYLNKGSLGDCDDYANFAMYCVNQLPRSSDTKRGAARILSIQWLDNRGKFHGHNVCIYIENGELFMISNGFSHPMSCRDEDVAIHYWVRTGQLLSWFVMDENLSVIRHHIGD